MSRQKLIKKLKSKNPSFKTSDIEEIIEFFSSSISNALEKGKFIEIRGFGKLYCKKLKENHSARNPRTKELIYKPERIKVRFRSSKMLKKIINE